MNRKFDDLGRISIPKEMRDKIGLSNGSEANIELIGNKIIITNPSEFDLENYIKQQIDKFQDDAGAVSAYTDILMKIESR